MRIDSAHLFRLPVVTEDGQRVGHVVGCVFDADAHCIAQYRVCPDRCVANWLHIKNRHELLVAPAQVLALRSDAMVVRSGTVRVLSPTVAAGAQAMAKAPAALSEATPTSSSAS